MHNARDRDRDEDTDTNTRETKGETKMQKEMEGLKMFGSTGTINSQIHTFVCMCVHTYVHILRHKCVTL